MIEVIGVFVATGDGKHAGAQDILNAVCHPEGIPRIGDQWCQRGRDPDALLRGSQQHHAAVRGEAAAIKCGDQFLAADGWKTEWFDRILGHGGRGSARSRGQDGFDTQSLTLQLPFFWSSDLWQGCSTLTS